MPRFVLVLLLAFAAPNPLLAQTGSGSHKPASKQQSLDYFAGTWALEVHMKGGPLSGMVFFGTEHNEWVPGGSLLLSHQEGVTPLASGGISILAYNASNKTYTYHAVKSTGESEDLRGSFEGNTWTWTNDGLGDNNAPKIRLIIQELSAQSYGLKFETSSGGHEWSTIMEGKANKALPSRRQDVAFRR